MSKENFLTSEKGKRITGMAYGLGASVVIIGALFKYDDMTFSFISAIITALGFSPFIS